MDGYRVVVMGTQNIDRNFEDLGSAMRFSSEVIKEACKDYDARIWVDVFGPRAHFVNQYFVEKGQIVGAI